MGFENGHLLRVSQEATAPGFAPRVMTFHYDLIDATGGLENNDPQDLADRFRDDLRAALQPWFHTNWTLAPVVVTDEVDPLHPTAPRSQWTSGAPIAGTGSSGVDDLPYGVCAMANLRTGLIGKRYNGRSFLSVPLNENAQHGGVLEAAAVTAFQDIYDTVPLEPDIAGGGGLSDASANLCVYSRTARAANQDPYASHVTAITVQSSTHYLRRRER